MSDLYNLLDSEPVRGIATEHDEAQALGLNDEHPVIVAGEEFPEVRPACWRNLS